MRERVAVLLTTLFCFLAVQASADTYVWENVASEDQVKNGPEPDGSTNSNAMGHVRFSYNTVSELLDYEISWSNLESLMTNLHVHGPATPSQSNATHLFDFFSSEADVIAAGVNRTTDTISGTVPLADLHAATVTPFTLEAVVDFMIDEMGYVNFHTQNFGMGEIRSNLVLTQTFLEQSKLQQKCTNGLNKNLQKVSSTLGKEFCKCISDKAKGKNDVTDVEACVEEDRKDKISKAKGKTLDDFDKQCVGTDNKGNPKYPEFAATDPNTVNQAAMDKEIALMQVIFGSDIDATLTTEAENKDRSKCQQDVTKFLKKCQDTKLKEFNKCKKLALKNGADRASDIADCVLADPKGKIAKSCDLREQKPNGNFKVDKVRNALEKKCLKKNVSLNAAFPGCGSEDPNQVHGCLETPVECLVCLAVAEADGLDVDCDALDNGVLDFSCGAPPNPNCEPLNATECWLPYPSDYQTVAAATASGRQLNLSDDGLPDLNESADPNEQLTTGPLNQLDGFSPFSQIFMHFPQGVDVEGTMASRLQPPECCGQPAGPPWVDTRTYTGLSVDANSPTVLMHADTGARVLHYIENDIRAEDANGVPDLERQALVMRPAIGLEPGERYIVALRNLKDRDGNDVEPEAAFKALRDSVPTASAAVESKRAHYEANIFPVLTGNGVPRGNLAIAFDFTVQSEHQLTHQMLSMRDQAFTWLAGVKADPNSIPFTVNSVTNFDCSNPNDGGSTVVRRRVSGTFESPLFLDGPLSGSSVQFMNVDANDTPVQNGFIDAVFDVSVPCSVEDPNQTSRPIVLGHGLFGTGASMMGIPLLASTQIDWTYIAGATDWRGLSSPDLAWVGTQIIGIGTSQLHNFEAFPDRLRQGMSNTLVLGKMMKEGIFNRHVDFQDANGTGYFPGASEDMYYYGISLGGIHGTWFSALTPDVERFGLDVPAVNFSCLLQRSTQFNTFEGILTSIGLTDPMDTILGTQTLHELWVSAEPGGFATHITSDPLPGSGSAAKILYTPAWVDKQVSNQCTEIAARTMGLSSLNGASLQKGLQDIPDANGPLDSALVMYDTGAFDILDPNQQGVDGNGRSLIPLLANAIPSGVCDPHGRRPLIPAGIQMLGNFLQPGGQISNFCVGICDAQEQIEIAPGDGFACDVGQPNEGQNCATAGQADDSKCGGVMGACVKVPCNPLN